MDLRLDEVPALKVLETTVPAHRFNRVRLALRRLGDPLRLALPKLRHLQVVLTGAVWVCVDSSLDDLPVVAWTDFAPRHALHTPVFCRLRIYHIHADLILDRIGDSIDRLIAIRLNPGSP